MPESSEYPVAVRALSWFRSVSRPDLGTVPEGAVVYVSAEHAEALTASPRAGVAPVAERVPETSKALPAYSVGAHIGGGVYTVLDATGAEVERAKGRDAAEARVDELIGGDSE